MLYVGHEVREGRFGDALPGRESGRFKGEKEKEDNFSNKLGCWNISNGIAVWTR